MRQNEQGEGWAGSGRDERKGRARVVQKLLLFGKM